MRELLIFIGVCVAWGVSIYTLMTLVRMNEEIDEEISKLDDDDG